MNNIKVYELDNNLKRHYTDIDFKDIKNLKDLVKQVLRYKYVFIYNDDLLNCYSVYVENIPKNIHKHNELTIVIDNAKHSVRYFDTLCN